MSDTPQTQPPGWYYAQGDPPGTQRYWNGAQWEGEPQAVPGAPQPVTAGGILPAEPLNRIAARLIDVVLWIIVGFLIQNVIIGVNLFDADGLADVSYGRAALAGLLNTLIVAGYEIYMVGTRGATLGKIALGLKVVRAGDGGEVDMNDSVRRISPYLVLGILSAITGGLGLIFNLALFIVGIVSLVFLFSDERRQTVWDRIAKTMVISTK